MLSGTDSDMSMPVNELSSRTGHPSSRAPRPTCNDILTGSHQNILPPQSSSSSSSEPHLAGIIIREDENCPVPRVLAEEESQISSPITPPESSFLSSPSSIPTKKKELLRKIERKKEDTEEYHKFTKQVLYLPGPGLGASSEPPELELSSGSSPTTSLSAGTSSRSIGRVKGAYRSSGVPEFPGGKIMTNGTLSAMMPMPGCRCKLTNPVGSKTTGAVGSVPAGQFREPKLGQQLGPGIRDYCRHQSDPRGPSDHQRSQTTGHQKSRTSEEVTGTASPDFDRQEICRKQPNK